MDIINGLRLEKENTTQKGNDMKANRLASQNAKNQIKQALLTLGFKQIDGHYFTMNDGENRFCTGEYEQKEIDTFLKVISKVGRFSEGERVVRKEIPTPEGWEKEYGWFISSPDTEEDESLDFIRFVNVEFDGDKFSSLWINYSTIESGGEFGPFDWSLY